MAVDITAFRRSSAVAVPTASLTATSVDGDTISDYPKAVQWVLSQLFSRTGSTLFRTTEGASFIAKVIDGRVSSDVDVRVAFASAALQVMTLANGKQTSSTPATERVLAISLGQLTVSPGQLTMTVTVRTANSPTSYKVPITLNLRGA